MNILIVTTTWKPELSGIAEATFNRVMALAKLPTCNLRVLAPDYSAYAAKLPNYGDYVGRILPNVEVKTYPTRVLKSVKRVSTEARLVLPFWKYGFEAAFDEFAPDVIHVEEPCRMFGLRLFDGHLKRVGVAYKRAHHIPATCMWRTDYFQYAETVYGPRLGRAIVRALRPLFAWVYNAYDRTFCSSPTAHARLTWAGVKNLVQVQAHGIDMHKFQKLETHGDRRACNLLYVGRVSKEKNIGQLIEAFRVLASRHAHAVLNLVGSGPLYDELSAAHAGDGRIRFHGKVDNERLPQIYAENDIFVNPSHTETFGLSTLEACACSLPVLVADRGGFLTERDEANLRCSRYRYDDAKDLVDKLERLVVDPSLRATLGRHARDVAAAYDTGRVAENFYREWLHLIRKGGSSPACGLAEAQPGGEMAQ